LLQENVKKLVAYQIVVTRGRCLLPSSYGRKLLAFSRVRELTKKGCYNTKRNLSRKWE